MAAEVTPPSEITITFVDSPRVPTIYAHGVFGSVGPHGDIVVNFYTDYWSPPQGAVLELKGDGTARESAKVTPEIRRVVVARAFLPPAVARAVGEWLIRHADEAPKIPRHEAVDDEEEGRA